MPGQGFCKALSLKQGLGTPQEAEILSYYLKVQKLQKPFK